jgi:hypothetical protein
MTNREKKGKKKRKKQRKKKQAEEKVSLRGTAGAATHRAESKKLKDKGTLGDFLKGQLDMDPEGDKGQPKGGLGDFLKGKLREKQSPWRRGGLRAFLSGEADEVLDEVSAFDQQHVAAETAYLDGLIDKIRSGDWVPPPGFLAGALSLSEKMAGKRMSREFEKTDKEEQNLAARVELLDELSGFYATFGIDRRPFSEAAPSIEDEDNMPGNR